MTMAGLKPHHKIALEVSVGVDSIALCILTAGWKTDAQIGKDAKNGCINGLLAIVVDHGLREESKMESNLARNIVSEMGVRCEIASCNWPSGMPKQGRLQEAARDMRYRLLQKVCMENQIDVLLVAHHADDQAELFILRQSRNSSVLGLAGMAFTSQLFPTHVTYHSENSSNHGILLICRSGNKKWVEDPTNKKTVYARNRICKKLNILSSSMKQQHLKKENTPMSDTCEILICDKRARDNRPVSDNWQTHVVSDAHLTDTSSPLIGIFKSEIQAIILACRKSRSYVDKICCDLIKRTVTVTPHGCAIIDLEKLDPANVEDICLSKFIALVLQFISQRHRPVRGRTSKLVLDYIRNLPCKLPDQKAQKSWSAVPLIHPCINHGVVSQVLLWRKEMLYSKCDRADSHGRENLFRLSGPRCLKSGIFACNISSVHFKHQICAKNTKNFQLVRTRDWIRESHVQIM